jgi:hypothetical protein
MGADFEERPVGVEKDTHQYDQHQRQQGPPRWTGQETGERITRLRLTTLTHAESIDS